jgi:hypothetical protein
MKKFGKKANFVQSKEKLEFEDLDDISQANNFYENELSKKLKSSNIIPHNLNYENENVDNSNFGAKLNYLAFKKKYVSNKIKECNNNNCITDNFQHPPHQSKDLIRLSELEDNNLYYSLNLNENCTFDEMKKAYRSLCLIHHPDKGGDPNKFNKINKAYKILSNETCRKLYDTFASQAMNIIEYILSKEGEENDIFKSCQLDDLDALKMIIQLNMKK